MRSQRETPPREEETPFQLERQNNVRAAIRLLVGFYIAYIIYKLVRGYAAGEAGMSLPAVCAVVVLFLAAEVFLDWSSRRSSL